MTVVETQVGDSASLTGDVPRLSVVEEVAGLPSYTGIYRPSTTGDFSLAVRQLESGGLMANYFDNQWLLNEAVISRIDMNVDFDWLVFFF